MRIRLGSQSMIWPAACLLGGLTLVAGTSTLLAQSQVFIVQTEHQKNIPPFHPTSVKLDDRKLTPRGHRELLTAFIAEQGFARRPMPLDPRGVTLQANGDLKPDGVDFEEMLQRKGISAKAGDRMIITDMKIEGDKIVFDFNGGPDRKHKYLRHISLGANGAEMPVVRDDGQDPVGSRLTLTFHGPVPEMTADQLRALIQPVMDFNVKTPMEAYVDTLPPLLKEAILQHRVLVGMDRKMVIYALGQPHSKVRESRNGVQFEEWIFGEAPQPTQFVRFEGTRVVQVEIGAVGGDLVVRNQDETNGYTPEGEVHEVKLGDAAPNATEGDAARHTAPSLRLPGETLPGSQQPVMAPAGTPIDRPQPLPGPPGSAPSGPPPQGGAPTGH